MILSRPWLLLASACLCGLPLAMAQDIRVEQARDVGRLDAGSNQPGVNSGPPLAESPSSREDDSFGVQQVLQEKGPAQTFSGFAEVSAMFTNNAGLTRNNPRSDSFLVSTFGFGCRRELPLGLQLDVGATFAVFRYNKSPELGFNSIEAGAALTYHTAQLGGLDLSIGYSFTELSTRSEKTFFRNHALDLSVQRVFTLSHAQSVTVGLTAELGLTDPRIAERSEYAAFADYHLQATRRWDFDLLYRYAYYNYAEDDRGDHNQTVTLGSRYNFTSYFSIRAISYVIVNLSNHTEFDYVAGTVGGGVDFKLSF